MLRRMVKSQARILVPGSNLSALAQAFRSVSCTRSSARVIDPESEAAKARRLGMCAISPSLKLSLLIALVLRSFPLLILELGEEHQKPVWNGSPNNRLVMRLQGA